MSVWIAAVTIAAQPNPPFWDRFLTSAGFAGCMAVVAASIAALVTWRQLSHAKTKQKDDRWWETLTWVFDRSVSSSPGSEQLPAGVALPMLQALFDETAEENANGLRKRAVGSILTMFTLPSETPSSDVLTDDEQDGDSPHKTAGDSAAPRSERSSRVVVDEADVDLLTDLRASVGDSSPVVAAALYEARVYQALLQIAERRDGWRAARHPVMPVGRPDFVLWTPSTQMVIETKNARMPITASTAAVWVEHLRKYVESAEESAIGVLLCNQPRTKGAEQYWKSEADPRLRWVQWSGTPDELERSLADLDKR